MTIQWKRLVDERGNTCDRCGTTGAEVREAAEKLSRALRVLEIDVVLEESTLSPAEFARDPLQSNRVRIDGRPIEELLPATVGRSRCCSVCGDAECLTLTVAGRTHEAIPSDVIVSAGLRAAGRLLLGEEGGGCCRPSGAGAP